MGGSNEERVLVNEKPNQRVRERKGWDALLYSI
jgi:hypothetical protein